MYCDLVTLTYFSLFSDFDLSAEMIAVSFKSLHRNCHQQSFSSMYCDLMTSTFSRYSDFVINFTQAGMTSAFKLIDFRTVFLLIISEYILELIYTN